jgi:hypothetical protein
MKRIFFLCLGLLIAAPTFAAVGEATLATKSAEAKLAPGFALAVEPHKVVSRDDSQRIWEQVKYLTNFNLPIPRVEIITNRYTEIGSGICYQQADGQWTDSQARFILNADGSIEATEMPHKVRISPDLHSIGAVKMTLPDGRLMSSTFRGLYLHDSSTQKRLLVSDITNSIGTLVSSNVLVYSNCFASLEGDLVLKVTPAGIAQDVVIRESLAWIPFDEIAFNPQSTVLEAWTEFYEAPPPEKQTNTLAPRTVAEGPTAALSDESLKFGDVLMVPGRAYLSGISNGAIRLDGPASARDSVPVGKTWIEQDNRRFLIERLRWPEILPHFKRLETNAILNAASSGIQSARLSRRLQAIARDSHPPKLLASASGTAKPTILLAQALNSTSPAFIFDYTTVTCSGGICNGYRFEPNETYFISSPIIINGAATLVGGTVIKIDDYETSAGITFNGTVTCDTGPGRMVIVTCRDDDSVGSVLQPSNHDPTSAFYGLPALKISSSSPATELSYLRVSYLFQALYFDNAWLYNSVWHSQFFSCHNAFTCNNTGLSLYNVLLDHVESAIEGGNCTINGEHVTAHHGSALSYHWGGSGGIFLNNSLIVGIPDNALNQIPTTLNPPSVWLTADAPAVFQSRVLGANYLAPDSPYRGIGKANIDARLRQALKTKTTHAPILLPATSSTSLILSPAVPRNTAVYPDIGYSYDVIDYVAQGLVMQAGTLLLTNGVVIGIDAGASSTGIQIAPGVELASQGSPTRMNRFVEVRSVQEQHGNTVGVFAMIHQQMVTTSASHLRLKFTEFIGRANLTWHIQRVNGLGSVALTDCRVFDGGIGGSPTWTQEHTIGLTNNLFEYVYLIVVGTANTHFDAFNNTFTNCNIGINGGNFSWSLRDNLFLNCSLGVSPNTIGNSHNGYYITYPLAGSGPNYTLTAQPNYQSGPLGNWYLPSMSSPLLNGGSRLPIASGLFHHTARASQDKEGSKVSGNVDVGFHYIAVEADNFAPHKYATQSTTDSGRTADRAIDGNTDGTAAGGSVSQTQNPGTPWWELDLGLQEQVDTLRIWNRTDCCANNLQNFYIFVSDDPFESPYQNEIAAQPGVSSFLAVAEVGTPSSYAIGRSARYIRFQKSGGYFSIAEVEVLGPPRAIDKEKDGSPDYFEDLDRDGNVDSGESDFKGPILTFTTPADGFSISTTRINVRGSSSQLNCALKQVEVNGIRAFLSGNTFNALNVPLFPGANKITAIGQDINGNSASASITVLATGTLLDPVTLTATPTAGFESLNVTFQVVSAAPGTFQDIQYDFNGDGILQPVDEFIRTDLNAVSCTYAAGEYFPVATVRTTLGSFSSIGGFNYVPIQGRPNILVQPAASPPTVLSISDPIDLKPTPNGHLFVLSRSTATLTEFLSDLTTARSLSNIGSTATGFDIDPSGKVYVVLSGEHKVARLIPTQTENPLENSFALDASFGSSGRIGSQGSGDGQFNSPWDVAVAPDGTEFTVTDSGNHRVQTFNSNGTFLRAVGSFGSGLNNFNTPRGISITPDETIQVADRGNHRIVFIRDGAAVRTFGSVGNSPGQFQEPNNISSDSSSAYIADSGNNRVQRFLYNRAAASSDTEAGFDFAWSLGSSLGLSTPSVIQPAFSLTERVVFIADTPNGKVLKIFFPQINPIAVWTDFRTKLLNNDIDGALANVLSGQREDIKAALLQLGINEIVEMMSPASTLTPIYLNSHDAKYAYTRQYEAVSFSFIVVFQKENGSWKIVTF